jgi:hypothetical protein
MWAKLNLVSVHLEIIYAECATVYAECATAREIILGIPNGTPR